MRCWTILPIRLVSFMAIGLTAMAVMLGRFAPRPREHRIEAPPRYQPIDSAIRDDALHLRLLDTETGKLEQIRLPRNERIDMASCSPWRDAGGRSHIVGHWTSFDGHQRMRADGLARVVFPGGEILDRIELDAHPASTFCWLPGTSARLLVTSWDGPLRLVMFGEPDAPLPLTGDPIPSVPLTWRCRPPHPGVIVIREPTCSIDPRMAHTAIVSLAMADGDQGQWSRIGARLWWLRLSDADLAIEDAGRLIEPRGGVDSGSDLEEHLPCVSATPDGGLALAFLAHRDGDHGLELRLARLAIDAVTGNPRVDPATVRVVAQHRTRSRPAFSPQGRWVYSFPNEHPLPACADRFSVLDGLPQRRLGVRPQRRAATTKPPRWESSIRRPRWLIEGSLRRPDPILVSPLPDDAPAAHPAMLRGLPGAGKRRRCVSFLRGRTVTPPGPGPSPSLSSSSNRCPARPGRRPPGRRGYPQRRAF